LAEQLLALVQQCHHEAVDCDEGKRRPSLPPEVQRQVKSWTVDEDGIVYLVVDRDRYGQVWRTLSRAHWTLEDKDVSSDPVLLWVRPPE